MSTDSKPLLFADLDEGQRFIVVPTPEGIQESRLFTKFSDKKEFNVQLLFCGEFSTVSRDEQVIKII